MCVFVRVCVCVFVCACGSGQTSQLDPRLDARLCRSSSAARTRWPSAPLDASNAATVVGTPHYLSPEMCDNKPYGRKVPRRSRQGTVWSHHGALPAPRAGALLRPPGMHMQPLGMTSLPPCPGRRPYPSQSDVWALGCLLVELAALGRAFDRGSVSQTVLAILKGDHRLVPDAYRCGAVRLGRRGGMVLRGGPCRGPAGVGQAGHLSCMHASSASR